MILIAKSGHYHQVDYTKIFSDHSLDRPKNKNIRRIIKKKILDQERSRINVFYKAIETRANNFQGKTCGGLSQGKNIELTPWEKKTL